MSSRVIRGVRAGAADFSTDGVIMAVAPATIDFSRKLLREISFIMIIL
jgi:hypothetical protein